jgi:hypothetical protein
MFQELKNIVNKIEGKHQQQQQGVGTNAVQGDRVQNLEYEVRELENEIGTMRNPTRPDYMQQQEQTIYPADFNQQQQPIGLYPPQSGQVYFNQQQPPMYQQNMSSPAYGNQSSPYGQQSNMMQQPGYVNQQYLPQNFDGSYEQMEERREEREERREEREERKERHHHHHHRDDYD